MENFHRHFRQSVAQGYHVDIWKFIDSVKVNQKNLLYDIASIEKGDVCPTKRRENKRNRLIMNIVKKYEADNDAIKVCKSIAHLYMNV